MAKETGALSNFSVLATLCKCCSPIELLVLLASSLATVVQAATMPLMTIIFGEISGKLVTAGHDFSQQLGRLTVFFTYLAALEFVASYVKAVGFNYVGERIAGSLRHRYLASLLDRSVAYVSDSTTAGEIFVHISTDADLVQDALSEKMGRAIFAPSCLLAGYAIGFSRSWRLTLILSPALIACVLTGGLVTAGVQRFSRRAAVPQAAASTVALEALTGIDSVVAMGCQPRFAQRYEELAERAQRPGVQAKLCVAFMAAALTALNSSMYALGFWQGARLLAAEGGHGQVSEVLTVLLSVLYGTTSVGLVGPSVQALGAGLAGARRILDATDEHAGSVGREEDDGSSEKPAAFDGEISLQNVSFAYASRPGVPVLRDVSLRIPAGKTTALVGASGSGKSSILNLIERFYDPTSGTVAVDGRPLPALDRRWLRRQMSLVSQEAMLFDTTVFENIANGLVGTAAETADAATRWERVVQASKTANAHHFIEALPDGYATSIGERGLRLSGGQRQRIAIARAIVSAPNVLLLDEATSALDAVAERAVQTALSAAMRGRTCVVVAHRLSTVRDADWIVVMDKGSIAEQGQHAELVARRGLFYRLLQAQRLAAPEADGVDRPDEKQAEDASDTWSATSHGPASSEATASAGQGSSRLSGREAMAFVARFTKPDRPLLVCGVAWSLLAGCATTAQSFLFAEACVSLQQPDAAATAFWSAMLAALAGAQLVAWTIHGLAFALGSERLLRRARCTVFRQLLRQDAVFFDAHPTGALLDLLAARTADLAGATGATLSAVLTGLATLVSGIALACAAGWKLALVCAATVPVILAGGRLRMVFLARHQAAARRAYAVATGYACEAASPAGGIQTVAALGMEQRVLARYRALLDATARRHLRLLARSSVPYAASQAAVFGCFGLSFWYGGRLVARGEYSAVQFFVCFVAVVFGAQAAAAIFGWSTDLGRAQAAAAELKAAVERRPAIDVRSGAGAPADGPPRALSARQLAFSYPATPDHARATLSRVDVDARAGSSVALVGPSGSGKSTLLALLMRFYDPQAGSVALDHRDVRGLHVASYRRNFALVTQETRLFSGSIRDNITLAASDAVSDEAIERACRDAAIHDFVASLPHGLDTAVGSNGLALSGGQRQRIAIARALLADARVLLLDEATSALDTASERLVHAAITRAQPGRITVAVAQRLSTIRHADRIYVFQAGTVVEHGSHDELMIKGGLYATMVHLQE